MGGACESTTAAPRSSHPATADTHQTGGGEERGRRLKIKTLEQSLMAFFGSITNTAFEAVSHGGDEFPPIGDSPGLCDAAAGASVHPQSRTTRCQCASPAKH